MQTENYGDPRLVFAYEYRPYLPHIVKYKYTIRYGKIKLKHCWWSHFILKPITQFVPPKKRVTFFREVVFCPTSTCKGVCTLWKTPLAGSCEIMKDLWVLEWRPRPVAVSLRDLNRSLARNARYKQISYGPTLCKNDRIRGKQLLGIHKSFSTGLFSWSCTDYNLSMNPHRKGIAN